ncbi:HNH endonuclease [Micromonospora zamorensis]|uniref:HNH endonuclease n=1 Tax=Micromonospora zamorensis TaxID=709883 RepID=UPI002E1A0B5A
MSDGTATKSCSRCGESKPLTDFQRRRASVDGLQPRCKACASEYKRTHYLQNRQEILAKSREHGREYRAAHPEKVAARHRGYREANRDAIAERMQAYRQVNREAIAERERQYAAANPEIRRGIDQRYKRRHRDALAVRKRAYRQANPEKIAEQWRRWSEANPDKAAANARRWRAAKAAAYSEPYTRAEVWAKSGGVCGICDHEILAHHGAWHIDHIMPLSRGGDDTLANVQASHAPCNLAKGNRIL